MIAPHVAQQTWLHRIGAGTKLLALAVVSILLGWMSEWVPLLIAFVVILGVYIVTIPSAGTRLKLYRPLLPLLVGIGLLQIYASGWEIALATLLRLVAMMALADLVTATTPMLDMMDALQPVFRLLRPLGLDERRLSLAVALMLRFIPVIMSEWGKREEAWRARTGRRPPLRLLAPFLSDVLRLADHASEALTARGFDMARSDRVDRGTR
ncbi:energy-coupling factor transporter transmembrane component T [Methylocella sp. CPCC 101449]|uniref:energy-coupling factor transporter transmembrane component T family protein n=1 Tax=Methylocella sp. CPCC 101449 TaxID=2987531 RepID=UPI0028907EAD|nr:energy-coupling factor transporter transmembrane component T [Methylocella sp. CPCC 101449]MDT2020368.1 energy-coupling factor transporter transmembrane protein EcfT [Methylocella sp. CPCC 101449]